MKNLHDLLMLMLKKWYLFLAVAVLSTGIGLVYYLVTPKKFNTSLTYYIRDNEQGRMFHTFERELYSTLMDNGAEVRFNDELERLNSHSVMHDVIVNNGLQVEVRKKMGLKYEGVFPCNELEVKALDMELTAIPVPVEIKLTKTSGDYSLKAKGYSRKNGALDAPIEIEKIGRIQLFDNGLAQGTYKITIYPLGLLTDIFCKNFLSERMSDENRVLEIRTCSDMPARAELIMSSMVEQYNKHVTADKLQIAEDAHAFLDKRISQTMDELTAIQQDNSLSADKRAMLLKGKQDALQHLTTRQNEVAFAQVYLLNPVSVYDKPYTEYLPAAPKLSFIAILIFLATIILPLLIIYMEQVFKKDN